jgi:hypothetical protein
MGDDEKEKIPQSSLHMQQQHVWGSQSIEGGLKHIHTLPPLELIRDNWKERLALINNETQPDD